LLASCLFVAAGFADCETCCYREMIEYPFGMETSSNLSKATGSDLPSLVDRPKTSVRVVTVGVWTVSAFLLYKAMVESPVQSVFWWTVVGMFILCTVLTLREFLFRPVRVTTIRPTSREVVLEEAAPLRKRRSVKSLPLGSKFEISLCDSDNTLAYEVRIRTADNKWLTVADFLSKLEAEEMADRANAELNGW
jgi:hypothetical protein